VKCPMSPILEKNMLDNFEFIWRSQYRVQSYLHQDASISKSETPRSSTNSGVCNSCHSYDTKEYKNLLQATSYLWLALQGPALSLARLRYICSLEPLHVAIVLISIIFMLPMQYASHSKSCAATHLEQPQNNTYMERNRVKWWRVGVSFVCLFVCLLHDNRCGCVCVASKESTSFLNTIIYSLEDMGTTTSLICCHQKPLITPFLNIILTHCCG